MTYNEFIKVYGICPLSMIDDGQYFIDSKILNIKLPGFILIHKKAYSFDKKYVITLESRSASTVGEYQQLRKDIPQKEIFYIESFLNLKNHQAFTNHEST